jgi:quinolinate synthase
MSDNVSVENPNVEFVRPCNLCPHMKKINLPKILESLMLNIHEVKIPQDILEKARLPIERMLNA